MPDPGKEKIRLDHENMMPVQWRALATGHCQATGMRDFSASEYSEI